MSILILLYSNRWRLRIGTALNLFFPSFSISRSSHQRCSMKKGFLKNFTKFTGKHMCQACNFIKKETLAQVLCCEFCEMSKKTFYVEHLWWLLLWIMSILNLALQNCSLERVNPLSANPTKWSNTLEQKMKPVRSMNN